MATERSTATCSSVAGRCRANTLRGVVFDLKTFFTIVEKDPVQVTSGDVLDFITAQRGDRRVIRLSDRESGLSAWTIARRLSSVSGLYAYLVARGDSGVHVNAVPRGLATRRQGGSRRTRSVPLVRVPRTLPKILSPTEVDSLLAALRTHRDEGMILAMVLGVLRRCEVLGLRLGDVRVGNRQLFIIEGTGGHHRIVPVSDRFSSPPSVTPVHPSSTMGAAAISGTQAPLCGLDSTLSEDVKRSTGDTPAKIDAFVYCRGGPTCDEWRGSGT